MCAIDAPEAVHMTAKEIVLQILSDAEQSHLLLRKTQLTKLFYLTEVEYFRETGTRLTDIEWLFYRFGPFAFELEMLLDGKDIERISNKTRDGHDVFQYKIDRASITRKKFVEPSVNSVTRRIVKTWGHKHLKELIDYVYLRTEPMQYAALRGDRLDFSTIKSAGTA